MMRALVCASLVAGLFAGTTALGAQTAASIGPAPAQLELAVGQVGSITVVLDGVQGAYGIDVRGTFDPNVIEIIPAQPNTPLAAGGFLLPQALGANRIDNGAGTFQWAYSLMSPSEPVSGSGSVFVLQVRGKSAGQTSVITLTAVDVSDRDGMALSVTRRSGTVRVLGGEGATPPVAPSATLPPPTAIPPTSPPAPTPAAPTPTETGRVLPGGLIPTPVVPAPPATSTPAAKPAGQASPTAQASPTRAVVNVTAQAGATATPGAGLPAPVTPAPPRAPSGPLTPTVNANPTAPPGTPALPGAPAARGTLSPTLAAARDASGPPTVAPEALAAVAQSGLAPKAPAAPPPGADAAPALPAAAASAPDPITGLVLLAIGLAGVYGFGAVDRQRRRR
jgi:hypothetical protein